MVASRDAVFDVQVDLAVHPAVIGRGIGELRQIGESLLDELGYD